MGRLTKKDRQGNWCIDGLPWKDTYKGQVITENTREKTYGAFRKLLDYEETGLTPEQVQELAERNAPNKPIKMNDETVIRYTDAYRCPNCGKSFSGTGIADYCYHCGQRLDWSEEDGI